MWTFNSIFGKIFDLIFLPFRRMNPWVGMIVISLLTALFMLFIFRTTSNQKGIKAVKNKIKAHLLEIRLFKDNLAQSLKAQGGILKQNARYIGYSGKPLLVMIIPLILILIQMNFWFGYMPLRSEEPVLLKIKLKEGFVPTETRIQLSPPPGIVIETPALRIDEEREINWRLSARSAGIHDLGITVGEEMVIKRIHAQPGRLQKISPIKPKKNFFDQLFYPVEPPLPDSLPLESVTITQPEYRFSLFGLRMHWIIVYFALSIIFGFGLKGFFGVEI
jgi:uncharacterized membrane protein (DUF106 family)